MRVVLDTNVLLVTLSRTSKYRLIFDSFIFEKITLCVSTDILVEYEEILGERIGREIASNVLKLIENAPNVEFITNYYKWNLITQDPDDNKFVDCAIAAGAKFLVSDDKHFNILKEIKFPQVELIKTEEFRDLLEE